MHPNDFAANIFDVPYVADKEIVDPNSTEKKLCALILQNKNKVFSFLNPRWQRRGFTGWIIHLYLAGLWKHGHDYI